MDMDVGIRLPVVVAAVTFVVAVVELGSLPYATHTTVTLDRNGRTRRTRRGHT